MAQIVGLALAGASIAAIASQPSMRGILVATLSRYTGFDAPGGMWRIAAILLALVNLKNLPFVWHVCTLSLSAKMYQVTNLDTSYASSAP